MTTFPQIREQRLVRLMNALESGEAESIVFRLEDSGGRINVAHLVGTRRDGEPYRGCRALGWYADELAFRVREEFPFAAGTWAWDLRNDRVRPVMPPPPAREERERIPDE